MYERKRAVNRRTNCDPRPAENDPPPSDEESRELADVEALLASFAPAPSHLDRDRTMFLAGRASAKYQTAPGSLTASISIKPARRLWPTAFAAMTIVSACLLVAIVVQQRSITSLRASATTGTFDQAVSIATSLKTTKPQGESNHVDLAGRQDRTAEIARQSDTQMPGESGIAALDLSSERILALADSGTLTARSLFTNDAAAVDTTNENDQNYDWPNQPYKSQSQPLPYYKLLRQLQQRQWQ